MPEQLLWSATAAVEPTASLAAVLAVLFAAHYVRSGRWPAGLAVVVAAAYAVQFRPESILILPVIAFIVWPRLRLDLTRPRSWWAVTLFSCLLAVHVAHLFAIRHIDWGTTGPRFSFRYIQTNLPVNGWFYLYDERFPGRVHASRYRWIDFDSPAARRLVDGDGTFCCSSRLAWCSTRAVTTTARTCGTR